MKGRYTVPKSITIIDGSMREGLQSEEVFVETETKLFLLEGFMNAGFKCMELGAFAPPAAMPQFRDTEELLKKIPRKPGILLKCNTFNMKLVERAVQAKKEGFGADIINTQFSTTEELSKAAFGVSVADRWKFIEQAVKAAHDAGMIFQLSILNPWYCPYKGELSIDTALEYTDRLVKIGCDIVRPCDPFGDVTPDRAYKYFSRVLDKHPNPKLHTFHLHDYRGFGLASYVAAMQAGCTRFDTSLGGIGGPTAAIVGGIHARGANEYVARPFRTGLVSTEDMVTMCDAMGIETGIDVEKVIHLGRWMERILQRKLYAFCLKPGRVPKGSQIVKGRENEMA